MNNDAMKLADEIDSIFNEPCKIVEGWRGIPYELQHKAHLISEAARKAPAALREQAAENDNLTAQLAAAREEITKLAKANAFLEQRYSAHLRIIEKDDLDLAAARRERDELRSIVTRTHPDGCACGWCEQD